MQKQIGVISVKQPKVVTRYAETAAWDTQIELRPGIFDLFLRFSPECHPQEVTWGQGGKILSSNHDSLFHGVVITQNRNKDVGTWTNHTCRVNAYELKNMEGIHLDNQWKWLLKDSSEWNSHRIQLVTERALNNAGFLVLAVKTEDNPNHFEVIVHEGHFCFEIRGYELFLNDFKGDLSFGDTREPKFATTMRNFYYNGQEVLTR